ncbi:MAG: Uma2 family endonuclease [Lamprobacter sp.]|uniref:Uma2 family endonuclease n=1 Tax=Lamprobacter sp. TaxID=3100796 RepID=UPI002B264421|nr:Uma2 family endonuclease [Lamprobacter sp.]MEA3639530.1 Uma2 family endonuclease [Lamprobacter sp.]
MIPQPPVKTRLAHVAIPAELLADAAIEDHRIFLQQANWDDFERVLAMRGERSVPRILYDRGVIEIMSPSSHHERLKSLIGCLVEVYCQEQDIEFTTLGSWTLKEAAKEAGLEPDECYIFGTDTTLERPHLAIEVIWTSGGIDKLDLYHRLGVAEVWIWRRARLTPYMWGDEQYQPVATSEILPGLDLRLLERFLDGDDTTSAAIRAYRAALSQASADPASDLPSRG